MAVPSRRLAAALAALCLLLVASGRARADRALARALVEEGQRLAAAGQDELALERIEQAIGEDADYLPAYDAAAALWLRTGRIEAAIAPLARVTLRHPRYAEGWYSLAFAYRRTGRHDLAALCYEAYLELRPREPDPYFGLAMTRLELGQHAAAAAALERYLALEDRPERASYVDRARLELTRLGRPGGRGAAGDMAGRLEEVIRRWLALLARPPA